MPAEPPQQYLLEFYAYETRGFNYNVPRELAAYDFASGSQTEADVETLADALEEIGIKPADVRRLAESIPDSRKHWTMTTGVRPRRIRRR